MGINFLRTLRGSKPRTKVTTAEGVVLTVHGRPTAAQYAAGVEVAVCAIAGTVKVTVKFPPDDTAAGSVTGSTDEFAGEPAVLAVSDAYGMAEPLLKAKADAEEAARKAEEAARKAEEKTAKANGKNRTKAEALATGLAATEAHAAEGNGAK